MAYLYQTIMNVPGLTGSSYERQKQYYNMLGAPKGAYKGTYDQNMWLLGQTQRPNYGLPQAAPAPAPAPAAPSARDDLLNQYTDKIKPVEKTMAEVLPQDQFGAPFEAWMKNFMETYSKPAFLRYEYDPYMKDTANQLGDLNQNIGLTGAWRNMQSRNDLGQAIQMGQRGAEQMWTNYNDREIGMMDELKKAWVDPLYKQRLTQYYEAPFRDLDMGPNAPQLDTTNPALSNIPQAIPATPVTPNVSYQTTPQFTSPWGQPGTNTKQPGLLGQYQTT